MKRRIASVAAVSVAALALGTGVGLASMDVGQQRDHDLASHSEQDFGVGAPLAESSTAQITQAQARAHPQQLVKLAKGLTAHVITANVAAPNLDQMVLWPASNPRYIITCNEEGTTAPGLQRIEIATGIATTIVTGTSDCDPVRRTPWGTVLFGEEAGGGANGGAVYELLDPVFTTGVTLDRTTGVFSGGQGADGVVRRDALGRLSFEGLAVYPDGVVYFGDENRPSSGTPGGAYFKFIPTQLRPANATPISSLADSPLTAGHVYGLRLGLRSGATDYGQGTNYGEGAWVPVAGSDLRAQAAALHLTGYYRPEDAEIDPVAQSAGNVRFCGNNTGNDVDNHTWGETVCFTDGTITAAQTNAATPEVQPLVLGSPAITMPDNIAYQPGRGNFVLHEDADTSVRNNDLWDCLDDGQDADLQSDGCVRVGTLNDLTAEWTGGFFDPTGKHFIVSVQHNVSGFGTLLDITGWK